MRLTGSFMVTQLGGARLATVSTTSPQFQDAMEACVRTLRRVADYQLDPALDRVLLELGERKEFLTPEEHAEVLALVAFTQQRTIDKLEARAALQRLAELFPELAGAA
jgi:hypothetical protein